MSGPVGHMLEAEGPIAARLGAHFEPRAEQVQMAEAVAGALARRGRLLVEAATGVGKSFAYLLPAIDRIVNHGERVVVATNTITLQEQLLNKDVPLLRAAMPNEFSAVLVKGRQQYLSIRRLEVASRKQETLLPDVASRTALHAIEDWAYETSDGTLSTLPQLGQKTWDRVKSDVDNCMGRQCPTYDKCFYQRARRRMERGDLLICNHALFFSDLALRRSGRGFLPEYQHVILDEAHFIEDVATNYFGASLAESRVNELLGSLRHKRSNRGFLTRLTVCESPELLGRAIGLVERARSGAQLQFDRLRQVLCVEEEASEARVRMEASVEDTISEPFKELALCLKRLRAIAVSEDDQYELASYSSQAAKVAEDAHTLLEQTLPGCVYWIDVKRRRNANLREEGRVTLECSPVEVGATLKETLFNNDISIVLTSATLAAGTGGFDHFARSTGCDLSHPKVRTLALGSPFDLASQIEVYLDGSMPDPRQSEYVEALSERVAEQVIETGGGAFVLFTSLAMLSRVAGLLRTRLEAEGIHVFAQGIDGPRDEILAKFRASRRGALFGAASFWQGVDVRGEALRNVIITKLPFEVPSHPLAQARSELIRERGQNPFEVDALPRAALRFKQGVGRLVRSSEDRGRVVVLDPRIVTAGYGKVFLDTLPAGVRVHRRGPEGWLD